MAKADGTIKVGMIGCGGNARHHMGQLLQMPGVEITALCDTSPKMIEAARKQHPQLAGVKAYRSHQAMLAKADLTAVEISTPHTTHFQQIVDSLAAGFDVMCEKPLVCTVAHCRQAIKQRDQSGKVLMTAYQRHFAAPYRYCREAVQGGRMGPVQFVSCLQSQQWYEGCVLTGTWRGKLALSGGGQLNDSGSHLLDIVMWMTGVQPQEVHAFIDNLGSEVDILTALTCRAAGGALLSFSVVGDAVNWLEDITIWCKRGTLAIRGGDVIEWSDQYPGRAVPAEKLGRSWSPDLNFIAAIRGEEEIQTPPEEFLKVIQLTEAAWKSGASGKPVKVK